MKKTVMLLLAFGLAQAMYCQKTINQKLDELMAAYSGVNKFNGTVLIARKGKVLLEKGYGIRNDRPGAMNNVNSIFQIYSVTKTFTSTAILRLVEQNKLSLSDRLDKFYPRFPKGDSITIEHLLTHTSGIYDYTRGNNMVDKTEPSFIQFISSKPLDFSPGKGWAYSNSGYWLLGFIIQKVTGTPYEEYIQQNIFKPLRMEHSGLDFKNLADPNKTTGYAIFQSKKKKEAVIYDPPGPYAAGAIYSTVEDLYRYYKGLMKYSIVSKNSLEKAFVPFKNKYGYGWIIDSFEGKQLVSHSGGAAGYRSNFATIPGEDICVILLNNNENASVGLITTSILNILFEKPYKIPFDLKLPLTTLVRYVGAYSMKPSFAMYVTIEDGRLVVQASAQQKTYPLAQRENYFYAEEARGYLEFKKDSLGNYNELVLSQSGQEMIGKRIFPTWGLNGTATSKGWDDKIPDIQLTQDSTRKGLWTIKNIALKKGYLLFRLNNDWGYHFGNNENDKILDLFGKDLEMEEGIYDITLDLQDESEVMYEIIKK